MKVLKGLFTKCLWTILMIIFGWVLGMATLYASTDSATFKHLRHKYGLD